MRTEICWGTSWKVTTWKTERTLILLKRNIVRLGIGYSWLRIVAPTDVMVLNLQVWLPEGVVC